MHFLKNQGLTIYNSAAEVPMGTKEEALTLYKKSADAGMTFWQYLELCQPSKAGDNLTAFERQLALNGLIVNSKPELGLFSSPGEYFFQSDRPGSAVLFPVLLQKTALWSKLKQYPDINSLVATTRTISGTSAYSVLSVDDSAITGAPGTGGRRFRVDQRGNFPRVGILWSDKTNAVTKHGVQLDWSYEFIRRASIEMMQTVVQRIMLQDQIEVFNDGVTMLINGDAGANPACKVLTIKKTAAGATATQLISSDANITAGQITYEIWLKFLAAFRPYKPNAVFGNTNTLVKLISMSRPAADPTAILTQLLEAKSQGNIKLDSEVFPNVTMYVADNMPDDKILAVDTSFACERVIELGSDIQEVAKVIERQVESMVISIADNVSKLFNDAAMLLDFSGAPAA